MNYPSNEEVGKEFDERFSNRLVGHTTEVKVWKRRSDVVGDVYGPEEVKEFLRETRLSDLEAIHEMVEDVRDKRHSTANEAIDDILIRLNSLKENK